MAIKSPSLLWNIGQNLGKGDKEQARSNAGVDSIKRSDKIEHQFLTHIAENSTSGNLEAKYAQPVIGDVSGLSTALSNLKTFYATKSTTFNELLTAYNNGQTLLLRADYDSAQGGLYKNYIFTLGWISQYGSTIDAFEFIAIEHFATNQGDDPRFTKSIRVAAWTCRSGTNWDADPYINWVNLATTEYADYNVSPTFQDRDATVATGDKLLISDASADGKEVRSGISFSTIAAENLFLNERGEWKSALPTIYNTDASTSVHWDDLDDEGFYSVLHSPSPTDDSTSPEQHDMFALVGNSGTVGGTYRAQLAMGDSLFYRHTTGANNVNWTDWHTVLTIGSQNIGNAPPYGNYQPVYIKDGEITACPMLFGELSSENGDGITLRYDSANNWYCIGTMSYTAFNKYVKTTGTDPDIVTEHFEFDKASSLVFGDGFGVGTNQPNYWGLALKSHSTGGTRSPLVIEAPSVTYACTTLTNYTFNKAYVSPTRMQIEFWNEHRIKDFGECSYYRYTYNESTSYVCTNSIETVTANNNTSIAVVPAHHWALINGVIEGTSYYTYDFQQVYIRTVTNNPWRYEITNIPTSEFTRQDGTWKYCAVGTVINVTSPDGETTFSFAVRGFEDRSDTGCRVIYSYDQQGNRPTDGYYNVSFWSKYPGFTGDLKFCFYLHDSRNNPNLDIYDIGHEKCISVTHGYWTFGNENPRTEMHECYFNFFTYNPTNKDKYVICQPFGFNHAHYSIHKQILIFKTPELGGFNWPYVAPPSNRQVPVENEPNE
jgi:hypothetical protein